MRHISHSHSGDLQFQHELHVDQGGKKAKSLLLPQAPSILPHKPAFIGQTCPQNPVLTVENNPVHPSMMINSCESAD